MHPNEHNTDRIFTLISLIETSCLMVDKIQTKYMEQRTDAASS